MNKIRAIFFDIDGTLVGFKSKVISDKTIQALKQLKEQGIMLIIASGRSKPLINNLKDFPFDGYITMNGALVYFNDKIIFSHPIERSEAAKIANISKKNNFSCVAFMEDDLGINFESEISKEINEMLNIGGFSEMDLEDLSWKKSIYQFTIYIDEKQERNFYHNSLNKVAWHRWHNWMSDAIPLGISKAVGVKAILKHLNIEREETISFGDGGNDIEMLKTTGLSIAMGNARNEVKQVSDYITDDVENNGVVRALDYLGLLPYD